MKRLIYIVFALCSIGFTGSLLMAQHLNLLIGLIGFAVTFFLGAGAIENLEISEKKTKVNENTYIENM
jgi:hypothetical protein